MSTDREDRWGNDDDQRGRRRSSSGDPVVGRSKARTAGMVLLLYALFSLVWSLGLLGIYAAAPEIIAKPYHDLLKDMTKDTPKQPGQPEPVPPYEDFKTQMQVQGSISTVIVVVGSLLMVVGAVKMRSLSSRGFGLTASVLAMVPCFSSCCLAGLPIGIWALVVLSNADVKAAFEEAAMPPDDR